jgi:folylpolyglutamate synthase/dihydropteroate synthase
VQAAVKTGVRAVAARDGHEALETAWAEASVTEASVTEAAPQGSVVIAGSVYLVGEVRPLLERALVDAR